MEEKEGVGTTGSTTIAFGKLRFRNMAKGLFLLPLLVISTLPTLAQWIVGPQIDLAAFRGYPKHLAPGLGGCAAYGSGKRNAWTVDVAFHLPHVTSSIWDQGPRGLATLSDTTSSTWHGSSSKSHVVVSVGFCRTFNRHHRSQQSMDLIAPAIFLM